MNIRVTQYNIHTYLYKPPKVLFLKKYLAVWIIPIALTLTVCYLRCQITEQEVILRGPKQLDRILAQGILGSPPKADDTSNGNNSRVRITRGDNNSTRVGFQSFEKMEKYMQQKGLTEVFHNLLEKSNLKEYYINVSHLQNRTKNVRRIKQVAPIESLAMRSWRESLWTYNCSQGGNPYCLQSPTAVTTRPRVGCGNSTNVDLVMIISSAAPHFAERIQIRRTWASGNLTSNRSIRAIFLAGYTDPQSQVLIDEESFHFGDILQGDFKDTYRNLTLKTIMGYTWFREHCPHAKYLLKADDDVFINTDFLIEYAYQELGDSHAIGGYCGTGHPVPDFGPKNRWYISPDQYPDPVYPAYCCGCAYVISGPTACDVAEIMRWLPIVPLEDVFTGLAMVRTDYEISFTQIKSWQFHNWIHRSTFEEDVCNRIRRGRIYTIHHLSRTDMVKYYRLCRSWYFIWATRSNFIDLLKPILLCQQMLRKKLLYE